MSRVAVCNSACLIAFRGIGRLDILTVGYDQILIPPDVRAEVRGDLPGFDIRPVRDLDRLDRYRGRVHRGEAAAIALAMETPAAEVVLDDFKARQLAVAEGLKLIGVLGLLLRAKAEGRIPAIRPLVDALAFDGFRMSHRLMEDAFRIAGEQ